MPTLNNKNRQSIITSGFYKNNTFELSINKNFSLELCLENKS